MKQLLSLILIMMAISSASYAAVIKTDIIEEEVCPAVAGCSLDTKTGECPDCIIVTRKVVTVIEDKKETDFDKNAKPAVIVEKKKIINGCFVLVAEKPRPCDWKMGAHKMIAAKKRARKECGGFDNWVWTNDTHTEYECKG